MKVKLMESYEPQVFISKLAYDKTVEYITQSKGEVGWLGTAVRVDKDYYIEDTYLFKQEVSSVTTEIKEDGLNEFAMELISKEGGIDIWNKMRVWGHSHVDMSTSPSGQDDEQMNLFLDNPNDFFIRVIGNKSEEFKIDIWDFNSGLIYENADFTLVYDESTENMLSTLNKQIKVLRDKIEEIISPSQKLQEEIKAELKEKVKEKKYVNRYNNVTTYNDYYGYGYDYGYGYNSYNKSKKKEDGNKAEKVFSTLTEQEIFTLMTNIEEGFSSADIIDCDLVKNFNKIDFEELDDLVSKYCFNNISPYMDYMETYYE